MFFRCVFVAIVIDVMSNIVLTYTAVFTQYKVGFSLLKQPQKSISVLEI